MRVLLSPVALVVVVVVISLHGRKCPSTLWFDVKMHCAKSRASRVVEMEIVKVNEKLNMVAIV